MVSLCKNSFDYILNIRSFAASMTVKDSLQSRLRLQIDPAGLLQISPATEKRLRPYSFYSLEF